MNVKFTFIMEFNVSSHIFELEVVRWTKHVMYHAQIQQNLLISQLFLHGMNKFIIFKI